MNKKGLITIGTLLIVMLSTPFLGTGMVGILTADQIYQNSEEIPQKELGLVLGAAAYGDRLSDVLRDRVDTAVELYKAEKISILIMSGAQNEVEAMQKHAVNSGIPAENITMDAHGLNTLASVQNIAELERSVTIITQHYHLPRAIFVANASGIDAIGMVADKSEYVKIFEFKKREILATSKAIFDVYRVLLQF